jgi:uncharacterized protein (DUF433 family)
VSTHAASEPRRPWVEVVRGRVTQHALQRVRYLCGDGDVCRLLEHVHYDRGARCWRIVGAGVPVWCLTLVYRQSLGLRQWASAVHDNWPYLTPQQVDAAITFAVEHADWIEEDIQREHQSLVRLAELCKSDQAADDVGRQ